MTVLFALDGKSQEYLIGFNGGIPEEEQVVSRDEAVATLPFFDDFTQAGYYPDDSKWQKGNVFVNSGFPKMPVNYRAATLDLIDRHGKVYRNGSSNPFRADTLLSVRIRLDSLNNQKLTPADSLYLSFYYQPGGFGDDPERDDSLVLKFGYGYNETVYDTTIQDSVTVRKHAWRQMWAAEGQTYESFIAECDENQYFKKVMIPITDTCLFQEDFYIMFFNYGTLPTTMYPNDRSNMDQWNVDFVYLDKDRSMETDTYPLVSFTNTSPTFLKRYRSMPYKHYANNPINEIENCFNMYLTNMDVNTHEVRYSCEVEDNNSDWSYSYTSDPFYINQYSNVGVMKDSVVMGNFIYPYNLNVDTTSFTIRHYVDVVDEHSGEVAGDSIVVKQGFYNYFAYDDGTPEMGYGLVPNDTYFAAQFKVTQLDTVCGVQMLFNRTFNDANFNFFDIVVWKDNNGKPGQVAYTLQNQRPIWDDSLLYAFSNYTFNEVVKVNSTFYVGIRQQYPKSINIGFDTSVDNHQYCFYDAGEGWKNTSFAGSLMIRPVMGSDAYFLDVDENQEAKNELVLYPNPANDMVRIDGIDANSANEIVIFDIAGRAVKHYQYCNELNVSDLQNGAYMLRVVMNDGSSMTSKLLIAK
ncbi:MAG: T9SS type A sorting domain-containing protein [Bacteroidales bacterium]|nr:T9SS type A sorting domain-containing protein [Bacteroidales bacterium]